MTTRMNWTRMRTGFIKKRGDEMSELLKISTDEISEVFDLYRVQTDEVNEDYDAKSQAGASLCTTVCGKPVFMTHVNIETVVQRLIDRSDQYCHERRGTEQSMRRLEERVRRLEECLAEIKRLLRGLVRSGALKVVC